MAQDRGHDRWVDEGEREFDRFVTQNPNSPEAKAHKTELYSRLQAVTRSTQDLNPTDIGSPEWRQANGQFWRSARTETRIPLTEVASKIGVRPDVLRFVDTGLILDPELGLLEKYAQALGKPELLGDFAKQLQTPNWQERTGYKMSNYDSLASNPLMENKDVKGLLRAATVGAVVGIAVVTARTAYKKFRG